MRDSHRPFSAETRRAGLTALVAVLSVLVLNLCFAGVASLAHPGPAPRPTVARLTPLGDASLAPGRDASATPASSAPAAPPTQPAAAPTATLPGGRTHVFDDNTFVVAYYGTAGTGVLGVLGRQPPDRIDPRLTKAAHAFARPGQQVQKVYELIVTVADGRAPRFNHDIAPAAVRDYIAAAHRHGALLVLDVQPGRQDFLDVVKRWAWALQDPWVGLALDPEWRMGRGQRPGSVIGSVAAGEINRVSGWLSDLVAADHLPEKLFLLHEFRSSMIRGIGQVVPRPGLAMVQHVDGFGTPREKLDTFHAVARPRQFHLGFKLFYQADVGLMRPAQVLRLQPRVRFVSYQ